MKAGAYKTPGPIDHEDALQDIKLEKPEAIGCDLLVRISAVSVNPVDTKLRRGRPPAGGEWQVRSPPPRVLKRRIGCAN